MLRTKGRMPLTEKKTPDRDGIPSEKGKVGRGNADHKNHEQNSLETPKDQAPRGGVKAVREKGDYKSHDRVSRETQEERKARFLIPVAGQYAASGRYLNNKALKKAIGRPTWSNEKGLGQAHKYMSQFFRKWPFCRGDKHCETGGWCEDQLRWCLVEAGRYNQSASTDPHTTVVNACASLVIMAHEVGYEGYDTNIRIGAAFGHWHWKHICMGREDELRRLAERLAGRPRFSLAALFGLL